jgi:hypothetical protein
MQRYAKQTLQRSYQYYRIGCKCIEPQNARIVFLFKEFLSQIKQRSLTSGRGRVYNHDRFGPFDDFRHYFLAE